MNVIEIALVLLAYGIYVAFRLRQAKGHQARLDRIRYVARFFKWICYAGFGLMIYMDAVAIFLPDMVTPLGSLAKTGLVSGPFILAEFEPKLKWLYPIFWLLLAAFFCRGIWFFYRLFSNLEKGILFGSDNVRCIRCIGWWLVAASLLGIIIEASKIIWTISGPGMIDLSDLGPSLLRGFFVIFVAWIMDEGRKIHEEQELTV
jgi:hypothetical protein